MRIAICDDEEIFAKAMEKELRSFFADKEQELQLLYFQTGEALLAAMDAEKPDLLFMDIQLGEEDGVELVRRIRKQNDSLPVIFLTNMESRVLDGYEVKAFYFLFKKEYQQKLPIIMERYLKEYYYANQLVIKDHGSVQNVLIKDIYWVEADKRNTMIHTEKSVLCDAKPIGTFYKQLPEWLFIEAYHCLYVNLDHISRVDADSLLLDDGEAVPVSRRNRKEVMAAVMRRMAVK